MTPMVLACMSADPDGRGAETAASARRTAMTHFHARLLALTVTLLAALRVIGPASAATSPYCGLTWGSLPKAADAGADTDLVTGVRAGRHDCFDRLVVDLRGGRDEKFGSYEVRYVPVVLADGSGKPIPLRGEADLQVVLRTPSYDQDGNATFTPAAPQEMVDVAGYSTFRQVASAGSFEGYTTIALGVRARLPFRVFLLAGAPEPDRGPRLVIDVAHRW
jgi:hypothetical protein